MNILQIVLLCIAVVYFISICIMIYAFATAKEVSPEVEI